MTDEKITAYLDGQLSERERIAFEARLRSEDALQFAVEVTRLAIRAAQQLPVAALPRQFTLPASMAQPERIRVDWRLGFRMGSAIAAALFVVLIGLDVGLLLQHPALQPVLAPAPKEAPQPTLFATLIAQPSTEVAHAASEPIADGTQLAPLPQAPRSPHIVAHSTGAEIVVTLPQARATKSLNSLSKLTPTLAATALPTVLQTAIKITPAPKLTSVTSVLPPNIDPSLITWPRALAGVTLAVGAILALLGWRKS